MRRTSLATIGLSAVLSLAVTGLSLAQGRPGGGGPGGGGGSTVDHKAIQQPPIKLGTSGGNVNDIANGYCSSGTLGALLRDDGSGIYYVLSNSHVLAHDIAASATDPDIATLGDPITQPGLVDTRCGRDADWEVANLASLSSLGDEGEANVDAAVAWVIEEGGQSRVQTNGEILEIGMIGSSPLDAFVGQRVKKSGRTTGLTKSQVDAINATVNVQYDTENAGTTFVQTFTGQIIVRNRGSKFLNSGDSGSLMVEDVSTAPRPIGLLYAGGSSIAVANPAQDVLDYLNEAPVSHRTGSLAFVGVPGAAGTSVSESVPTGVVRAIAVQEANAARLVSVPGAAGHAVGVQNGVAVIKVYVERITPEARAALPERIDGIAIVMESVGRIVGY